ncbi:hypothetical protein QQG74_11815 [Micromonospora sp. FIMYZ51]|uniref:hypothetical protein n=1 Tax=Micromonospora sp. FIMYZ51 TaxID=3051832 RepID=UPI00311EFE94
MSQPYGGDQSRDPGLAPPNPPASGPASASPASARRGAAPGHRIALVALAVAALALLLAFGTTLVAWRALDQARDAKAIALNEQRPPEPSPPPATIPAPGDDVESPSMSADVPLPSGEAPVLNEQTEYKPKYAKQPLVFKASCSTSGVMYADLDEPRALNDRAGAEIQFRQSCGTEPTTFLLMNDVDGSEAATPGMEPKECAEKIRSELIPKGDPIPVRKNATLCLTTDYQAARDRGEPWRIILLQVVGMAIDGTTSVEVSAWDIPD